MGRDFFQNHTAGGNLGAFPDDDIAEDLGPGADEDSAADFWMTVATLFAGSPQGDFMKHGDIVTDDRGLADDHAGGMINENPFDDAGRGVDINGKDLGDPVLEVRARAFRLLLQSQCATRKDSNA